MSEGRTVLPGQMSQPAQQANVEVLRHKTDDLATAPPYSYSGPRNQNQVSSTDVQHEFKDRPSVAREAREMVPNQTDAAARRENVDTLRYTTDNTAGYNAGTGSRGGGSGGTTEAMTGGVAAGGALGDDDRRAGMGDIARGQL